MRLETRQFGSKKHLLLIAETKEESALIDATLGSRVVSDDGLIATVKGEVRLADGFADHYIRLEKK